MCLWTGDASLLIITQEMMDPIFYYFSSRILFSIHFWGRTNTLHTRYMVVCLSKATWIVRLPHHMVAFGFIERLLRLLLPIDIY